MHALITGGAGFIGSHLAERLIELGHTVTVIDDLSTGRLSNIQHLMGRSGFRLAIETIMNEVVMDRLVSECDILFHLAAAVGVQLIVSDPVRVIETNVLGSRAVLKVANRYRKKVVISSSSEIYGKLDKVPFSEEDDCLLGPTTKNRWSYASSKAIEEYLTLAYWRQYGLPVVIARLFNTVGRRQRGAYGMVVPRFVSQALKGEPITVYGDGNQSRCFAHVRDVVEGLIRLAETPAAVGGIFNLGSQEEVTILQLAKTVKELTGSASEIRLIPYDQAYEMGFEDMKRRVPDLSRAAEVIGYSPRYTLRDTLMDIIGWLREEPDGAL
jgi:UDP-glucose 4-epimerase